MSCLAADVSAFLKKGPVIDAIEPLHYAEVGYISQLVIF